MITAITGNERFQPAAYETNGAVPATKDTAKLEVWLVDDNASVRDLVSDLLNRKDDIRCTRQFSGPDDLLSALSEQCGPDAILLDVQMHDRNGLDAVRPIKELSPATCVIMFTTCFSSESYLRAMKEGASGYLLKGDGIGKAVAQIRKSILDRHDPAVV